MQTQDPTRAVELEQRYGAHNYHPLPVVLVRAEGCYAWDEQGRRYLDMMSAYSAVSHGHAHPRLVRVLHEQAQRVAVTSRAFHSDRLGPFLARACELTGQEAALPMNTGAEAVDTAIKAARKWAYTIKGVAAGRAEVIACRGNFHGRTLAAISLSSEPRYRYGFEPLVPGMRLVDYGDIDALEEAIRPDTAAFLVEPIQGEGGVILPPAGYLAAAAALCRHHRVLLIADEVQTGLGRTGRLLACEHEQVVPDALLLGKALGGGLLPVSLFLARREVMDVFGPGDHGSTFGGSALASAVALEALEVLVEERLAERSAELGAWFLDRLQRLDSPLVVAVRGRGLFLALEVDPRRVRGRVLAEALLRHGVLTKETHEHVLRLAPPLTVTRAQLEEALRGIEAALHELAA